MTLHDAIQERRHASGLSRAKLAARVGLTEKTITRYEQGTSVPSFLAAVAIADALDVPIADFASAVREAA